MSAPDVVVRAVQEALGCKACDCGGNHPLSCLEHDAMRWTGRGCEAAVRAADAAHKASRAHTLREAAARFDTYFKAATGAAATLRRWADESEGDRG